MFENPGGSLKKIGGAIFFIGMIVSVIGGMWMFNLAQEAAKSHYSNTSGNLVFAGIIIIAMGCFISYIISVFISAFGELVENSTAIRYFMENKKIYPTSSPTPITTDETVHSSVDNKPS